MGNLIGCFGASNSSTSCDPLPHIILTSSSGVSGRKNKERKREHSESSSSGNSGVSFGEQASSGDLYPPTPTQNDGQVLEKPNLKVFTFSDLKSATRNFKPETLLGEGGFGRVYKGWIEHYNYNNNNDNNFNINLNYNFNKSGSKFAVAIKKLNSGSMQGFEEWQSEVNFLGRLSHPNLVKLLGYCWEDKELLLVYEYLPKGSLENHLFRRNPVMESLSWDRRVSIALGVAKGLAFLHSSDKHVIYRDFKAANILLDVNYEAKISDFGLAKLGPSGGNSHVTTRIMGTHGYAAPEYVATGHLYVKSDVYGFGVVLLEMLTGLRAVDMNRPKRQQNLVAWAKPCLSNKRKLRTIMDMHLDGQYSLKSAFELAQLTVKCLAPEPKLRPCMKDAVQVLGKVEAMKETRSINKRRSNSAPDYNHRSLHYQQQRVLRKETI